MAKRKKTGIMINGRYFIPVVRVKDIEVSPGVVLIVDNDTGLMFVAAAGDVRARVGGAIRGDIGKRLRVKYPDNWMDHISIYYHHLRSFERTRRPKHVVEEINRYLGDRAARRIDATAPGGHYGVKVFTYLPTGEYWLELTDNRCGELTTNDVIVKMGQIARKSPNHYPVARFIARHEDQLHESDFQVRTMSISLRREEYAMDRLRAVARLYGTHKLLTDCIPLDEWKHPAFDNEERLHERDHSYS